MCLNVFVWHKHVSVLTLSLITNKIKAYIICYSSWLIHVNWNLKKSPSTSRVNVVLQLKPITDSSLPRSCNCYLVYWHSAHHTEKTLECTSLWLVVRPGTDRWSEPQHLQPEVCPGTSRTVWEQFVFELQSSHSCLGILKITRFAHVWHSLNHKIRRCFATSVKR